MYNADVTTFDRTSLSWTAKLTRSEWLLYITVPVSDLQKVPTSPTHNKQGTCFALSNSKPQTQQ